jgi:hypothetical protein
VSAEHRTSFRALRARSRIRGYLEKESSFDEKQRRCDTRNSTRITLRPVTRLVRGFVGDGPTSNKFRTVLYCAQSLHSSRRVRTCSVVGINGAAVLLKSKKRGLHDATMRAELEASFYTGMHGLGFINVLNELEFWQLGNVLYEMCCTLTISPITNSVMDACCLHRKASMQRSDSC